MKILITGATGFVGRNLIPKLFNDNHDILELTRSITKSQELFGTKTFRLDITDIKFKEKILEFNPEVVIHLASFLTSSDKFEDVKKLLDVNILFLSKVLDSVSKGNLKLFINTGTFAEYLKGNENFEPAYFYAATKTASRALVDYYSIAYDFKQCTIVPYTIYGGEDSQKKIIDLIYDSTRNNIAIDLSKGEQVLDFIHIDDVTDFYALVIRNINKLSNKSNFKLGTGIGYSLRELANKMEKLTNLKANVNWGAKKYRKSDVMHAVANIDNIKKIFFWEPKISLEEGLLKLIDYKKIKKYTFNENNQ
jgi:nucleoside-diphosphate-sugar epimerase